MSSSVCGDPLSHGDSGVKQPLSATSGDVNNMTGNSYTSEQSGECEKPSPGLNMEHGFVKKIERMQLTRDSQHCEDEKQAKSEATKMARRVGFMPKSAKPTMALYRPPAVRVLEQHGELHVQALCRHAAYCSTAQGSSKTLRRHLTLVARDCESADHAGFAALSVAGLRSDKEAAHDKIELSTSTAHGDEMKETKATSPVREGRIETEQTDTKSARKREAPQGSPEKSEEKEAVEETQDVTLDMKEVDIAGFGEEARPFLQQSILDPCSLNSYYLAEVAKVICNRAMDDRSYCQVAGKIFRTVIKKEAETSKEATFFTAMMGALQLLHGQRERMKKESAFAVYMSLLCEVFRYVRPVNPQLGPITQLLFSCFHEVIIPPDGNYICDELDCMCYVMKAVGGAMEEQRPTEMS
ncbi:PREDICTED: uncharacterized protein LOC106811402, partial [Priapulus caudatus]|uniref:Uncharacterized protein LOC106811402 n=1 Tax=Priapulus caudatus TaxID=37621 RepID=A0ABM1EE51_PRICU